jgi:asparagine N-glycosylation enzyme membrane subunit Stt3
MPKFTVCLLNPPYNGQKKGNGDGAGQSIWAPFIENAYNSLESNGYLCAIHPSTWRYGKTRTLLPAQKILFSKQLIYLKTQMPFPSVGTIVDYYILQKREATEETLTDFLDIQKKFKVFGKISLINHYQSNIVNSIFEKVFKTDDNGLKTVWGWGGGWKNIDKIRLEQNYEWVKGPNKLKKYGYPYIHHFNKKVIGRVSRKINAFYDNGNIGIGDHNYYLLVDNDIQGKFIETVWNSNLMLFLQKFNSIYFWDKDSSFRNSDIPFKRIIPEDVTLTTEYNIYTHYCLDTEEVAYIETQIK